MLDLIKGADLRKTTTAELNKWESRNSLLLTANLHRLDGFRYRSQENFSIQAYALNLVVTAIIHCSAIYTGRVVDALPAGGHYLPDDLLSSRSSLTWKHLNLTGDYILEDEPALNVSGFRTLRFPV